jgi:hypothetical protein
MLKLLGKFDDRLRILRLFEEPLQPPFNICLCHPARGSFPLVVAVLRTQVRMYREMMEILHLVGVTPCVFDCGDREDSGEVYAGGRCPITTGRRDGRTAHNQWNSFHSGR